MTDTDNPFEGDDGELSAVLARWRRQGMRVLARTGSGQLVLLDLHTMQTIPASEKTEIELPPILLQAGIVTFGNKTHEGQLIEAVSIPWFEIIEQVSRDRDFMFKVPWRKLEELIAGAFCRAGYTDVTLTPPSGDGGKDIIATRPGVGSVRIFGQVKAYKPGHVVEAEEARALLGVLDGENVSKGLLTTTSDFAPRIHEDAHLKKFLPHRLELMNGERLLEWLIGLGQKRTSE